MKITEQQLWYLLDMIAVRESGIGKNMAKSDAAARLMSFLVKPTPQECQQMFATVAYPMNYEVTLED